MKKFMFTLLITGMLFTLVACTISHESDFDDVIREENGNELHYESDNEYELSLPLSDIEDVTESNSNYDDSKIEANEIEIPKWVSQYVTEAIERTGPWDWVTEDDRQRFYDVWLWLEGREANNTDRVLMFRHNNTRREEIQHLSRHLFEQQVLPQDVYYYESFTLDAIETNDLRALGNLFDHLWQRWATNVIRVDLLNDKGISEEELDLFMPYIDDGYRLSLLMLQLYGISALQQIDNITTAELADGTNIVILEMNQTGWLNLSTYIAIVYIDDGFGLQVFTLEKAAEVYFFSAVHPDSRENLGEIENDLDVFIDVISIGVTGQPVS